MEVLLAGKEAGGAGVVAPVEALEAVVQVVLLELTPARRGQGERAQQEGPHH